MDPASLIVAGGSIASSSLSALTARTQQRRANEFNYDMWRRTNAYNSPAEQMKRLQQAGLNPNLIYGNGASGASGQASPAPEFAQLAESGYKPVDIPTTLSSMQEFTNWDIKKAQEDKLQTEADLLRQKILTETYNQSSKILENTKSRIQLRYADQMAQTSLEGMQANNQKTLADIKYTTNQDVRSDIQLRQNILESTQRILASKSGIRLNDAQIQKIMVDTRVQEFFAKLADANINPHLRPEITELGGALANIIKKILGDDFSPGVPENQRKQLNQPYFPRK